MTKDEPTVVVISGPNGAGKSTISERLLRHALGLYHFVNANTIARGLSAFRSEEMAFKAGKIMLEHIHELAKNRRSFAFETTLATRSFAPWIKDLRSGGYWFHLYYLWIPSPEVSIRRVRKRVAEGGHGVPEETIRQRYQRGLDNFFRLYRPLADSWEVYDNSSPIEPRLIADEIDKVETVADPYLWNFIKKQVLS